MPRVKKLGSAVHAVRGVRLSPVARKNTQRKGHPMSRVVKSGTMVKIKNYDALSPLGVITDVLEGAELTTYMVKTMDSVEFLFRDQFTIVRTPNERITP